MKPAGAARNAPLRLLSDGYTPKFKIQLFGLSFYLTGFRYDDHLNFFVAYVVPDESSQTPVIYPRIFYKDISLVWRCATHYARSHSENWIGKGDLKRTTEDGVTMLESAEETTNLPLEMQPALDTVSRRTTRKRRDDRAVPLILRKAPDNRLEPYADFTVPRRRAMAKLEDRINRGESVAYFRRQNVPESLTFARGFEPDFRHGLIEYSRSGSALYRGPVKKYRILSTNERIQYQFVAAKKHIWINPPQTLTTELSTYGVRTVDVRVDDDLCVPGYEYHYWDASSRPPELHSQIPPGFAGEACALDPSRADASKWIDRLPVIQEFRSLLPKLR